MGKTEKYPLVSVVIPTYNRASLLLKAVQSVLEQTQADLELIIADDGSTDQTAEWVQTHPDSRLRYIRLDHSGHIGYVRNAGASVATGKWIAFLDADDYWLPPKLAIQLQALSAAGGKWSYCGFLHVDPDGNPLPAKAGSYRAVNGKITRHLLTHAVAAIVCSLVVERDLFQSCGGFSTDSRLALRGDYEFVLRLSQLAGAVAVPQTLVHVLEHENRITKSVTDPFSRSMVPYLVFLETQRDPKLRNIAREQINRLIRARNPGRITPLRAAWMALVKPFALTRFTTIKLP